MMNLIEGITEVLKKRTCIVGMGNPLRSDDRVAIDLVSAISDSADDDRVSTLIVEDVLENYVFSIAEMDCDNIILVDAVETDFDCEAGTVFFGPVSDFDESLTGSSTHKPALDLTCRILADFKKKVYLLGITIKNRDFGNEISAEVIESADMLKDIIINTINHCGKELVNEY